MNGRQSGKTAAVRAMFFRPYKVCICGDFVATEAVEGWFLFKCLNCGGLMSLKRLYDSA